MGEVALRKIQAGIERAANPTVAPTPTATGSSGTLPAGTYTVAYSYYNPSGQTLASPTATVTITLGQGIQFAALTPLPAGATGVNYFISAAGGTAMQYVASGNGAILVVNNPPLSGAYYAPLSSTGQTNAAYQRGVFATATRRLYGTVEVQRGQAHRFAVEDRGSFTDKFRSNPKLVEATFKLDSDATFEDLPFMLDTVLKGGVTPVATQSGAVQTWTYVPDQTSDTLSTRTLEVGAEDVQWRGQFATTDSADFTMTLDDALKVSYNGFVADWQPQGVNSWYGFSGSGGTPQGAPPAAPVTPLPDRTVESVMGYQMALYIDPMGASDVIGTTQTTGRFIGASWAYKNQNKRKYFGDNNTGLFSKLGRGRRQVNCNITFEALDTVQFQQWTANQALAVRVAAFGTNLPGTSPVVPKQQLYDFYGYWDTFQIGARETNVTWQLDLMGVYSAVTGTDSRVTVVNGLNAAAAGF